MKYRSGTSSRTSCFKPPTGSSHAAISSNVETRAEKLCLGKILQETTISR